MTAVEQPRSRPGVPVWLALALVVIGGGGAAGQAAVNARLGAALDSPLSAAAISNTLGGMLFVVATATVPRVRRGVVRVWRQRMPWWMLTGGIFGAIFVFAGAFAVPLIGVAVFTVAQVCGNSLGGLGTDAVGLGPAGRLRITAPRLISALLAIVAVGLAQVGRDVATDQWWLVPVVVCVGFGIALQGAFNGQVNEVSGNPLSTGLVNFVSGTSVLYLVVAVIAVLGGIPSLDLPSQPWLYLGGPLGAFLVIVSMIAVRVIGVLRMALAILTGQLAGALVLDVIATGRPPSPWVAGGVVATAAAVVIAGRGRRSAASAPPPAEPVTAAPVPEEAG